MSIYDAFDPAASAPSPPLRARRLRLLPVAGAGLLALVAYEVLVALAFDGTSRPALLAMVALGSVGAFMLGVNEETTDHRRRAAIWARATLALPELVAAMPGFTGRSLLQIRRIAAAGTTGIGIVGGFWAASASPTDSTDGLLMAFGAVGLALAELCAAASSEPIG